MKKIILFINALSSGGAEHQLVVLADGLADHGYDVTISSWADIADHYTFNPLIKRKIIAKGKPNFVKMAAIWMYFFTTKADCVISFGQRASHFALMPLFLKPCCGIKVIAGERNTTVGRPSRYERQLMNCLYRRAAFIVPNSHAQRQHIVASKPRYENKTLTITNYTDLYRFIPTPLPGERTFRIGVFGRYDVQKNCMRFVEAVRALKNNAQQSFVIEWYGNQRFKDTKPNPFYLEMKEKVIEYGLEDILVLNDHVKDVVATMPRFDAICLPSLWEGFSNSISEAICCGKPCLVSDVADNKVMVQDGVNGYLFDPMSVDSMVDAFNKYFTISQEARIEMGKNSRRRAEELFDKDRFVNAYINLIES